MDDSVPGSHRRALATRRIVQAGIWGPGLEAERAELGLGPDDPPLRVVPEIDWPRLVHKSGLDRQVAVEEHVYEGWANFVARCRVLASGQRVALKILSPALYEELVLVERFEREVRILGAMDHENVVKLVDFGLYGYARWLMLEWVEGEDLRAVVDAGPLPVDTAVSLALGLTAGLAQLHQRGMVHRDVKPENILWDEARGRAVLTDFGIAKLGKLRTDDMTLTFTEDVWGTRGYIPPEAERGSKHVDARADVFATGIVLMELLTGQRPPKTYEAGWVAPAVDPSVDAIVRRCTALDPAHRYASAAELHAALAAVRPRGVFRRLFGRRR
jgi:serine/threonine protein kinase